MGAENFNYRNPANYQFSDIEMPKAEKKQYKRLRLKRRFWSIVHNLIAHPLLITGSKWADKFHDWTADKM